MEQVYIQFLIENALGRGLRREFLMGRHWLVAPVTMLVPGVLNGSGGPLLYRPERVAASVPTWDVMPLVNGHPMQDGKPVSARTPGILEKYGLGQIFHTVFNNALRAEAWFDVERTRIINSKILEALEAGKAIEVSTGLFLSRTKADDGAVYNGVAYEYDTNDYRPDHLAILIDAKGACSNRDGCGINNGTNQNPVNPTPPALPNGVSVNKEQQIQWLVTNCECWKNRVETLNKLTDDEIKGLYDSAQTAHLKQRDMDGVLKAVANSLGIEKLPAVSEIPALVKSKTAPVNTVTVNEGEKPKDFADALKRYGTPEDQATWSMAQQVTTRHKNALVERVVNALGSTDEAKSQLRSVYSKQSVGDLEQIVKHLPAAEPTHNNTPHYLPDVPQYQPNRIIEVNQEDSLVPTCYLTD